MSFGSAGRTVVRRSGEGSAWPGLLGRVVDQLDEAWRDPAAALAPAGSVPCAAGARVLMADGRTCPIEEIRPGEAVRGRRGQLTQVIGVEPCRTHGTRLFGLNGGRPAFTAQQTVLGAAGWRALRPQDARLPGVSLGDRLCRATAQRTAGAGILTIRTMIEVVAIRVIESKPRGWVFSLILAGDASYVVDGWVVHATAIAGA